MTLLHRSVSIPIISLGLLVILCLQTPSLAAISIFTDRTQWELAVGGFDTENFNDVPTMGLPKGTYQVGKITIDVGFDNLGEKMAIRDENDALSIDGTRHFGGQVLGFEVIQRPTIIFDELVTGFGADWADATNKHGIKIWIGQHTISLSDYLTGNGDGFLGVTSTEPFDQFTLDSISETFGMDNLSFTVIPEPMSILWIGTLALVTARRKRQR